MPFFFPIRDSGLVQSFIAHYCSTHPRRERERSARRTIDGTDGHTKNKHMASRVLANLLVACSGAVFRAASQAWSKALQNAKASGVHAEHRAKHAAGKTNVSSKFYLQSKLFRAKETLGKEVFGMTEEEASADPRKKRKEEEDKEGHRKSEGEKTTTTTNRKDALPNDDDKNAPTTTEKE